MDVEKKEGEYTLRLDDREDGVIAAFAVAVARAGKAGWLTQAQTEAIIITAEKVNDKLLDEEVFLAGDVDKWLTDAEANFSKEENGNG